MLALFDGVPLGREAARFVRVVRFQSRLAPPDADATWQRDDPALFRSLHAP